MNRFREKVVQNIRCAVQLPSSTACLPRGLAFAHRCGMEHQYRHGQLRLLRLARWRLPPAQHSTMSVTTATGGRPRLLGLPVRTSGTTCTTATRTWATTTTARHSGSRCGVRWISESLRIYGSRHSLAQQGNPRESLQLLRHASLIPVKRG